jgi:hypothetical protein
MFNLKFTLKKDKKRGLSVKILILAQFFKQYSQLKNPLT